MNYPTLSEALELHRMLIDEFGGVHGVRDQSLLESALGRPQTGYYDSLSMQAASLLESLVLNHPFLDGNKRVGFVLTATFLRLNGYCLVVNADDGEKFIAGDIARDRVSLENIATWLKLRMKRIKRV